MSVNPANRQLTLTLATEPNQTYVLQTSPDLQHWTALVTNRPTANLWQIIPTAPATNRTLFFRAVRP